MYKVKLGMVFVLLLLLNVGPGMIMAQVPGSQAHIPDDWTVFTHPEFGFSFSYPTDWLLEKHLSLAEPSGTVSISNSNIHPSELSGRNTLGVKNIEIGLHLVEWDESVTPREWANAYSDVSAQLADLKDTKIIEFTDLDVDGYPAVRKIATSPLLTYDVITIKRGDIMWFIWSNHNPQHRETFEQIVRSFQWNNDDSSLTFLSLGIEPTVRLDVSQKTLMPLSSTDESPTQKEIPIAPQGIPGEPPGYRMPFSGGYSITAAPGGNCGSPFHVGSAEGAIDFDTPNNTRIVNSSNGYIDFNGWNEWGYGNLVQVRDSSNRVAFYAHLRYRTSKSVGSYISQSSFIGKSGRSGCFIPGDPNHQCGYHLHFHVHNGGSPVDITGIPTMTWSGDGCSGFPDGWAQYTP